VDQAPAGVPKIESRLSKGGGGADYKIEVTSTDKGWQPTLMEISTECAFVRLIP
jgi:hypothetical protein